MIIRSAINNDKCRPKIIQGTIKISKFFLFSAYDDNNCTICAKSSLSPVFLWPNRSRIAINPFIFTPAADENDGWQRNNLKYLRLQKTIFGSNTNIVSTCWNIFGCMKRKSLSTFAWQWALNVCWRKENFSQTSTLLPSFLPLTCSCSLMHTKVFKHLSLRPIVRLLQQFIVLLNLKKK